MKIVGTLLVDKNDCYVYAPGTLPDRTSWDKEMLKEMASGETVSKKGYDMLPPSIQAVVSVTHGQPTFPVTIEEINGLADVLIVTRVPSKDFECKKFRFDNFKKIVGEGTLEIWVRK